MSDAEQGWVQATPTKGSMTSDTDGQIDLVGFVSILWRRKWSIILITLLSIALGVFYLKTATELYQSEATLILETQEQNATGLEGMVTGLSTEDTELNSQIEVIRSRRIVGQVVDTLNLHQDPEFVPELRDPSWIARTIGLVRGLLPGDRTANAREKQSKRETAIDEMTKMLSLSIIPKTYVFRIRLETTSPEKSAEIINTLAEAFVKDQVTAKIESTGEAADWLNEKVVQLGQNLAQAEAAAADYRSNTDRLVSDVDVIAANNNLKNVRGRRDSFLRSLLQATGSETPRTDRDRQRLEQFDKDIAELELIVQRQNSDLLSLRQLDREATAATAIYEHFVTRLNEIEVQKGTQESDVRILSAAIPRFIPTQPKKLVTMLIAGLFGLFLGALYVMLGKLMDRSFRDPDSLQQAFSIPVVGTIPKAPTRNSRRGLLQYALKNPASVLMESVRDLRTSVMFKASAAGSDTAGGNVLLMTSSIPGEGKTTSSILLAVNSAALDMRVLLIECDLRRSTFQTYFGRPTKLGLVNAIDAGEDWKEAVWTEPRTNMDIIFGGLAKGRNAADIFASPDFEAFVQRLRQNYDLVIFDTPPVLAVPDARLIARHSDYVMYAVRSAETPSSAVSAGLRQFENIGIKVNGFNLTQMKSGDGYGYGGYGYGYGGQSRYGKAY